MAREQLVSEKVVGQVPAVGAESLVYLRMLVDLGAVEGVVGRQSLNPNLAEAIAAMHHILAGGSVKIEVTSPGHSPIVGGLEKQLASAIAEANTVNSLEEYLGELTI
jgi:hypothetical protein